jgi:hypothetical protein
VYDIKSVRDDLKELAEEVPEFKEAARKVSAKWNSAQAKIRSSMLLKSPSSAGASYEPGTDDDESTTSEMPIVGSPGAFGRVVKVAPYPPQDDAQLSSR